MNNALGLQFKKDVEKLKRVQHRATMMVTGLEDRVRELGLFISAKGSLKGICWEPATTRNYKDVIKLFPGLADDIEGSMAQNCPSGGSDWSLGKYSSLEEQCSTGRGYS